MRRRLGAATVRARRSGGCRGTLEKGAGSSRHGLGSWFMPRYRCPRAINFNGADLGFARNGWHAVRQLRGGTGRHGHEAPLRADTSGCAGRCPASRPYFCEGRRRQPRPGRKNTTGHGHMIIGRAGGGPRRRLNQLALGPGGCEVIWRSDRKNRRRSGGARPKLARTTVSKRRPGLARATRGHAYGFASFDVIPTRPGDKTTRSGENLRDTRPSSPSGRADGVRGVSSHLQLPRRDKEQREPAHGAAVVVVV